MSLVTAIFLIQGGLKAVLWTGKQITYLQAYELIKL